MPAGEWISRQSRRRFRRHSMMRRLLIRVGKFEQGGFAIGRTQKGDAHGQIVAGEARWDSHRSGKHQKRIQRGDALIVKEGGLIPSFIYLGWFLTVLLTIGSRRLSGNTFAIAIVSSLSALRLGITIGSTTTAPAAFNSSMFF